MTNFTFFHNVFYAIYILKSFNSHISVSVLVLTSLNLGRSQNGVFGKGLKRIENILGKGQKCWFRSNYVPNDRRHL